MLLGRMTRQRPQLVFEADGFTPKLLIQGGSFAETTRGRPRSSGPMCLSFSDASRAEQNMQFRILRWSHLLLVEFV